MTEIHPPPRHHNAPARRAARPIAAWPLRQLGGLLLTLLLIPFTAQAREPETLSLAIVPQNTPLKLHRAWAPMVKYLEKETGRRIVLKLYEKISEFEVDLLQGTPDLVYLNPYHLVMVRKSHAYRPLVRDGKSLLSGILVVPSASPARQVADLQGAQLAFPSPNAFAASLYMRALLAEQEKIRFTPVYLGNHENVYLQVSNGLMAGGGGVERTLQQQRSTVSSQVRVIYRTPGVAPHPLAAHPRVSQATGDRIVKALLALSASEPGQAMLQAIQMPEPIEADFRRDYHPLLRLKLDKYVHRQN